MVFHLWAMHLLLRGLADFAIGFLILTIIPVSITGLRYRLSRRTGWRDADRSSAGLLPPLGDPPALVRIFAARTISWRSVVASHCWIVVKAAGAAGYTRYDYTAWGGPIRVNAFPPDGRWFGAEPRVIFAADGDAAAAMIPQIIAAVESYPWRHYGDYRVFPGPNSNSFVAAVIDAVPGLHAALPPTAIGKDYPYDLRPVRWTGNGIVLSLRGYAGLRIGWVDGFEIHLLGAVIGLDWRHLAVKLPGIGRVGWREVAGAMRRCRSDKAARA